MPPGAYRFPDADERLATPQQISVRRWATWRIGRELANGKLPARATTLRKILPALAGAGVMPILRTRNIRWRCHRVVGKIRCLPSQSAVYAAYANLPAMPAICRA